MGAGTDWGTRGVGNGREMECNGMEYFVTPMRRCLVSRSDLLCGVYRNANESAKRGFLGWLL